MAFTEFIQSKVHNELVVQAIDKMGQFWASKYGNPLPAPSGQGIDNASVPNILGATSRREEIVLPSPRPGSINPDEVVAILRAPKANVLEPMLAATKAAATEEPKKSLSNKIRLLGGV